jgi:hypothetical protein
MAWVFKREKVVNTSFLAFFLLEIISCIYFQFKIPRISFSLCLRLLSKSNVFYEERKSPRKHTQRDMNVCGIMPLRQDVQCHNAASSSLFQNRLFIRKELCMPCVKNKGRAPSLLFGALLLTIKYANLPTPMAHVICSYKTASTPFRCRPFGRGLP